MRDPRAEPIYPLACLARGALATVCLLVALLGVPLLDDAVVVRIAALAVCAYLAGFETHCTAHH